MKTVTVRLIGSLPPGVARERAVAISDEATIRDLVDEVGRVGGDRLRRALWTDDGRLDESVLIAIDGDVVDRDRLDTPLPRAGDHAEVSLFLIRAIFGGGLGPARGVR